MSDNYEKTDDKRLKPEYWRKWIARAKKGAKTHHENAMMAWREYEGETEEVSSNFMQPLANLKDKYSIYWSTVKHMEPAFYSRTPSLYAKRRFGINDPVSMTASIVQERLADHLVDKSCFDTVMMTIVSDFIHADKATCQLKYDVELEPEKIRVQPADPSLQVFMDAQGQVIDAEIFQDSEGYFYRGEERVPVEETQSISLVPCSFDEVLHDPEARFEDEIKEKAFKFSLTRKEAESRFGIDPELVAWKKVKSTSMDDSDHERNSKTVDTSEQYLEGFEGWCKETKSVYWYSDQYPHDLLDVKKDPYGLDDFFPATRFIIGSKPSKHMFPKPAFLHLYTQIRELHKIAERIPNLIDAARRRAIVAGDEDLVHALNSLEETEYIQTKGLTQMLEKGGVQNAVWFLPVQELVQSIGELNALTEKFEREFHRLLGFPDIMRGETDPLEAAETNARKANAGNNRFRYMKKQITAAAVEAIQMMVDLALKVFSDQKIARIVGLQYMSEYDKQRFPEALALLRNDDMRMIRLDIESDSMAFVDEQLEAAKMDKVSGLVTQGIASVAQIMQMNPPLAIIPLNVLLMSLENINPGRAMMDEIRQQIGDMIEEAKQAKQNPPPPPVDYEKMKLELQAQKLETERTSMMTKNQIEAAKLQRDDFKTQLLAQKQQSEHIIDQQKVRIDEFARMQEQQKIELEKVVQNFMMHIETMRMEISRFKAQGEAQERMMEEVRLARQVDNEGQIGMMQAMKPDPMPRADEIQPQPVQINIDASSKEPAPTLEEMAIISALDKEVY